MEGLKIKNYLNKETKNVFKPKFFVLIIIGTSEKLERDKLNSK